MTSLPEFLAKHTIKKEDKDKLKSTHTRMPDKELNIYPGSYHIPVELLPTFYKLYYDYLFVQGHKEYLTEKQQGKCIAVDFDLKYTFETTSRQHTKEEITDIVCIYLEEFKEYFVFTEDTNFDVFVFEKPNVNRLADESLTKDGIHIIFGIQADYKIQSLIRKKMIETLPKYLDLPLINTWENVLDEGISKGHTNWTLYGSRKPNHEAYELTHHYEITFDNSDKNFMMNECKVSDFDLKQDFAKLSVQYDNPVYSYTLKGLKAIEEVAIIPSNVQKASKYSNVTPFENTLQNQTVDGVSTNPQHLKYHDYSNIINKLMIGTHTKNRINRYKFIKASANINIPFELVFEIMKDCPNNNKTENEQIYYQPNKSKCIVGWNTIKQLAFQSNPTEKLAIDKKWARYDLSEKGMAETFYDFQGHNLAYQTEAGEDKFYVYYQNEWRVDNKTEITKKVMGDVLLEFLIFKLQEHDNTLAIKDLKNKDIMKEHEEKRKEILTYVSKIKSDKFKTEVMKQVKGLIKCSLENYEFDTNEAQHYNIHFKNGVVDVRTGILRKRVYDDYITQYLDYDYIEKHKISKETMDDVELFFKKLQPQEEQRDFTLGYLSYCLTGNTSRCIFKMNIGYSASNGKSTELKIHHKVFPIYTTKLDKETFMKGNLKRHKSVAICLHNPIRLAYIEELEQKKMDSDFLKDWVDGDKIVNEVMYGTTECKNIQAKLMTCSNKDMKIDSDKGVLRRGKVQFYKSQFLDDIEEDDYETHQFKLIKSFEKKFDSTEYKNAYFHLLLEYTNKMDIPTEATEKFKELAEESDTMKQRFLECFEITNNDSDRESKYFILLQMGKEYEKSWDNISSMLKGMGLVYRKDLWSEGKKGIFIGIKKIIITNDLKD